MSAKKSGKIYVGIGGWTFEPWRGVFYPRGLTQKKELQYAASNLTSIEIQPHLLVFLLQARIAGRNGGPRRATDSSSR